MKNAAVVLVAVLAIPLAAAVFTRIIGGLVLRPWPSAHSALERHWLWIVVPATAAYLFVDGAWAFAVLWLGISPLAVLLLKRYDYLGMGGKTTSASGGA